MNSLNMQQELKTIKKEGFLEKQSRFWKTWRKRWFVLTPNAIISFKEQKSYINPTQLIPILDIITITSCDEETHKQNCFKLQTNDTTFYICANSYSDKQQWIAELGKALVMASSKKSQNMDQ